MQFLIGLGINLGTFLLLHFVIGTYPEPLPVSGNRRKEILETIVIWAIMVIATTILIVVTPPSELAENSPSLVVTAILVLLLPYPLIPLVYVLRVNKWTLKDLGFSMPKAPSVTLFALLVFGFAGVAPLFIGPAREPIVVPHLLLALYMPAFVEEFFFRVIIQGKLERALGQNKAWFYSGILFGLAHAAPNFFGVLWYSKGSNIVNAVFLLIFQIIAGWVFGIIYMKTRSLLPSVVAHYITDWRLGSIIVRLFF